MNKNRQRERSRERRDNRRDGRDARRDLQSSSSAAEKATRLRMDSMSERTRTRPASPPRRKEIDNVMKKARREGDKSQFWNKKLLEVEEKDPNRWRHSGYKELYGERSSSQSRSRSRSRSPAKRPNKAIVRGRSPRTPPPRRSRSPVRVKPVRSVSSRGRPSTPPSKPRRSPLSKVRLSRSRSSSGSSETSCSDDQCSVCSPKQTRRKAAAAKKRSRSRSFSVPRSRPVSKPTASSSKSNAPGSKSSATIGRKPPNKPVLARVEAARSARDKGSPPRDPRQPTSVASVVAEKKRADAADKTAAKRNKLLANVKIEGQKRAPAPPESDSDDSSSSSDVSAIGTSKMTLSERFGKMAQWSVDRRDVDYMKNMKITKDSGSSGFKVVIDGPEDEEMYRTAAPEFADRRVGAGFFPEEMHVAPVGIASWDDVRVRYKYYKGCGYLRDLSLDDYVKWEEWWYKYQEWLETERYYDQWSMQRRSGGRHHRRYPRKRSVSPVD